MIEGFLFINKPTDITSHDCIKQIKKILKEKTVAGEKRTKIGHAGTLDPFATGLLIVGIGRGATKYLSMVMKGNKQYIATGKLGVLTDTLDKTGIVIEQTEAPSITREQLMNAIHALGNSYTQTPPAYSALKYKGQPLYKLARKGEAPEKLTEIIESKKRTVQLYAIELTDFNLPFFTIKADVSHGTYIRSLVNDIAKQCGSVATTWELARTKIGPITIDKAVDLNALQSVDDIENHLVSVEELKSLFNE